mmetsp:Transcript_15532/g.40139  ORF Transcript_15532/g.40139 Transcript_15532/m.40139 type:complete len:103 (-) Transcript_15532:1107-1415(-)
MQTLVRCIVKREDFTMMVHAGESAVEKSDEKLTTASYAQRTTAKSAAELVWLPGSRSAASSLTVHAGSCPSSQLKELKAASSLTAYAGFCRPSQHRARWATF